MAVETDLPCPCGDFNLCNFPLQGKSVRMAMALNEVPAIIYLVTAVVFGPPYPTPQALISVFPVEVAFGTCFKPPVCYP